MTSISEQINFDKNVLLVDVSYMTYARFFATRIWYNSRYGKEEEIDNNQDWTLNPVFMESFERLFFDKLEDFRKSNEVVPENIVYCLDSSFQDNWRLKINEMYKGTRKTSHEKNKFNSWDIFKFVQDKLLTDKRTYEVSGLEADDIVALLVKHLKNIESEKTDNSRKMSYFILANDKDYIQICNDRTHLIDINGRNLSEKVLTDCSNFDFLLKKILLGDKSDNIEACFMTDKMIKLAGIKSKKTELKCTPAKVRDMLASEASYIVINMILKTLRGNEEEIKACLELENLYFVDNQFSKNAKLIDFAQIPSCYICKCMF